MTEERISEVENRSIKFTQSEQHIENSVEKQMNLRDLWYNNIRSNIFVSGVPEGEEKRMEIKRIQRNNG